MTSRLEFQTHNYGSIGPKMGDEDNNKKSYYRAEQDDRTLGKEEEGLTGFFGSK